MFSDIWLDVLHWIIACLLFSHVGLELGGMVVQLLLSLCEDEKGQMEVHGILGCTWIARTC